MSRLLVLNAGSSSLKWKLFDLQPFATSIGGLLERIGDAARSRLKAKTEGTPPQTWSRDVPIADHATGMQHMLEFLRDTVSNSIDTDVVAVGHRVVHGLDIHKAVPLTEEVVDKIRTAAALAPLHNPAGLQGIAAAQKVFGNVPQVAVFDTAFHQTMPPTAFMYGLPYEYYERHHIRRYGFHGTSHMYLVQQAAVLLGKPVGQVNAITCHLGAGSSLAAIRNGASVDTTMGLTPLEGLMMATRSGDLDPAIPLHLQSVLGMSAGEVDTLLNKRSGLLGVCGQADVRSVLDLDKQGDARGSLALSMFVYHIQKYIGAYCAVLGGRVDALVFSAGIGENSAVVRDLICDGLQGLGIDLDDDLNSKAVGGATNDVTSPTSRVRVLVIPTDEELCIAQQTLQVVRRMEHAATAANAS